MVRSHMPMSGVTSAYQDEITHTQHQADVRPPPVPPPPPTATHNGVLLQHRALQVTLFPEFGSNQQGHLQEADPPHPQSQAPAWMLLPLLPPFLGFQLNINLNPTPASPPPLLSSLERH